MKNLITFIKDTLKKRLDNRKLTTQLVNSIGPEGIIGLRNMDYYTKKIGKMIDKGDIEGAKVYAKDEKYKVLNQK